MLRHVNNENTVAVHITETCNLACPGCYAKFYSKPRVQNLDKQRKILRELNPEYITIYGGEPLCDAGGVRKILDEFSDKKFILHTNATLPHQKFSDIYDRVDIIFYTIESFMYDSQPPGRKLNKYQFMNMMNSLSFYGDKGVAIHNVYPKSNDRNFYLNARKLNIPYCTYPIIAPGDVWDIDEREFSKLRILSSPLVKPKQRILVDGTVTRDMRGVYNEVDELPCHDKCLNCEFGNKCPYFTMFPHFVKDYLDDNKNHWFCEVTKKHSRN